MNAKIFTKIFIYVAILLIGFLGKKKGVFKREYTKFLNDIICYITLPSAIVNGFQGVKITPILLVCMLIGLFTNVILLLMGQLFSKNLTNNEKVIFVFSTNCFNIGNFTIPFLTGLISSDGFAAICMFDISVALMCFGANVALADSIMGGKFNVKKFIKKILTSPVFLTYMVLIFLNVLSIKIPSVVLELTTTMGNANSFIAMLCIGILFEFKLEKQKWKIVFKVLGLRISICLLIMVAVYFLIPLPSDIKLAICVVLMAPCAGAAPALTESAGADGSVSAVINSISIPLSMVLMTLMLSIL